MNVLVTGGAGYIGSVAVKTLLEAGHTVAVYDSLALGHAGAVSSPARLHSGDLADPAALDAAFTKETPDCVMHFAARSLVGESMEQPGLYFYNNVACGVNLLNACLKHGTRRFVFSSSAAVYGTPA
ncbi:MAG: NAD-dependent epimerase/dehydratase family protein, partial [bacterium]